MAVKNIQINLRELNIWEKDILAVGAQIGNIGKGDIVNIEIVDGDFIKPSGLVLLTLICKNIYLKTNKEISIISNCKDLKAYLKRCDFYKNPFIKNEANIKSWSRIANSPTVLEIIHLTNPNQVLKIFKERIEPILNTYVNHTALWNIRTMINEICNNAFEHSSGGTEFGECYLQIQKYKNRIYIAIGDIGIGITSSLQKRYPERHGDKYWLKQVVKGMSSRENSGGMGIPGVEDKTIDFFNGKFYLRSGKALIISSKNKALKTVRYKESFPGTQCFIELIKDNVDK